MSKTCKVLFPPKIITPTAPVIFLAGPIQGAPYWQPQASQILCEQADDTPVIIANPRTSDWLGNFIAQIDWEHFYLEQAIKHGVVMFWLPKEHEHDCNRAYAQTSRFELGWMMALLLHSPNARMVVGMEDEFSNFKYLDYTLKTQAPRIVRNSTLSATCISATKLLQEG